MSDIKVTVEPPSENQIVEVTYDGQEIVQPPFTQAEHLMRQATKLDFSTIPDDLDEDIDDDNDEDTEENNSESQENGTSTNQPANKWPWESVRDKLRDALAEVSVLSDVLSVATKECGRDHNNTPKKYMMLDGPTMSDQVEQKPYVSLLAKKKSLDGHVAKILLNGAEHLKSIQSENRTGDSGGRNFHFELLKLRQHWRLKKVSNTILGDLSFRTAGSQFKQSGLFEVIKSDQTSEDQTSDQNEPSTTTTTKDGGANSSSKSVLKVNVPAELEGMCYIQVVIQKESEQLISSTNICQNGTFDPALVEDVHWQKKLEQAQNVIFCKELFAQLAKEAIEQQAPVPHMVVGNQIVCALSPDIQLLITLKTSGFQRKRNKLIPDYEHTNGVSSQQISIAPQPAKQHDHVLEHSLHQLLRKAHLRNLNPESGGLSSSPVGVSKKRRLAGPRAADRRTLLKMASEETFLEQIILHAQHVVLRLRIMYVLDQMASGLKDPLITIHCSTLSSPTRTSVKVNIVTAGYENIQKTQFVIHVYAKKLTFVCKDGRVLNFSYEPQELRDFILCQISQHQINGVQALAKCTGWQVLSASSHHLGCGTVEPLGNATGCLLANPTGDRFIAVRHSPHGGGASVYVASAPQKDFFANTVVRDLKWSNLPDMFQEVNIEKMDGKNLLNKIELLMAAMTHINSTSNN